MAIKPKKAVLQIRLDSEDLERFQDACEESGETASATLRRVIRRIIADADARAEREALKLAKAFPLPSGVQVSPGLQKSLAGPVRQPQSLSERRKAEKMAKDARQARKDDRY